MNHHDDSVRHAWNTEPVQVWLDIDRGIAPLVRVLNTIPELRTYASCEGHPGSNSERRANVLLGGSAMLLANIRTALVRIPHELTETGYLWLDSLDTNAAVTALDLAFSKSAIGDGPR